MNDATTIQVARAAADDARDMQDVVYRGWLATYPNAEIGVTVDDIHHWHKDRFSEQNLSKGRDRIANPPEGQTMLTAKEGEKIVGVCRVTKHPDRNQLYAIYVLPDYHGRGIGKKMWQVAQNYLDHTKHTIVEVATYNAKAIKFYQRLGFVDTGKRMRNPKFTMKSGAVIPEMEMKRDAASAS